MALVKNGDSEGGLGVMGLDAGAIGKEEWLSRGTRPKRQARAPDGSSNVCVSDRPTDGRTQPLIDA